MKQIPYLILSLLILFACGSQKVITRYYVIEMDRDSVAWNDLSTDPIVDQYCEIDQVEVYPAYASTQIANRSNNKELIYYANHQWAVRPAESFTRMVQDYFKHVPIFKNTSGRYWKIEPAYRIETTVYQLEVIQESNKFTAHLDLEFVLKETEKGTVIIQHQADALETLAEKDLNLLAQAVGEIFSRELRSFSEKIISKIQEVP
jgi:ABC-type uncharacterized transport system auxiliary subunit